LEIRNLKSQKKAKPPTKRFYRKRVELFRLIDKIKLWPSRKGILHGIKTIEKMGDQARITTHCNKTFTINDSRNSRAARWLRNKWFKGVCGACRIPDWKLEKYSSTQFKRHYGSMLTEDKERNHKT
jgi:pyrrolysyl-tRNA synthetase-like protein